MPVSGSLTGQRVVEEALEYEGVPFVLGGPAECIPGRQMDCTCLTTTVFRAFGFELPDVPTALPYYGVPVYGPPRAGDVHVWGDPGDGTGGHVAIDLGNGNIVHANAVTMSTSVTPVYYGDPYYLGVLEARLLTLEKRMSQGRRPRTAGTGYNCRALV